MERKESLTICHLYERPDSYPTVAGWIHEEWWAHKAGHSVESMEARLRQASRSDRIPLSLLARWNGIPVGTINLVEIDSDRRPEWTPWLAALLVLPDFRGRGIGSMLVRELLAHASHLGIGELYLGTDIPSYYERFGAFDHEVFPDGFRYMKLPVHSTSLPRPPRTTSSESAQDS